MEKTEKLVAEVTAIEGLLKFHTEKLNELPKLADGRISDENRSTDFYKLHKAKTDKYFKALQEFNSKLTNNQKRTMAQYRRALKSKKAI